MTLRTLGIASLAILLAACPEDGKVSNNGLLPDLDGEESDPPVFEEIDDTGLPPVDEPPPRPADDNPSVTYEVVDPVPETAVDTDTGADTDTDTDTGAEPETDDTDPGETDETDDTDPVDTDPVDTDPVDTDPVDTDPKETDDPVDTDPSDTDPADTDDTDTDTVETDPNHTDTVETDPVDTDAVDTDPDPETDTAEWVDSDTAPWSDTDTAGDTDPGTISESDCVKASRVPGWLDQFQTPGDGKVIFCHRNAPGKWSVIDTRIRSCIPHAGHLRDIFPSTLCDS